MLKLDCKMPQNCMNNVVDFRRSIFDKLEREDPDWIWLKCSLRDVRRVVIIVSASRSGSSLLAAVIKRIPGIYSLSGESIPFYKLNYFSSVAFESDKSIPEAPVKPEQYFNLSRDFLSDFSMSLNQGHIFKDDNLINQYIDDLVLRFPLQWPLARFSYPVFRRLAAQAFDAHRNNHQEFCKEEFYLELLWLLRREYKTINPYYYDIPKDMIMRKFPGLRVPSGPPNDILTIEEPPFILLSPGSKVNRDDLVDKTLLLKTTVDCYRMHFVESLFPNAQIKIIYLIRNPLSSINGLYDGWLHRGFFSHNLRFSLAGKNLRREILEISGYSGRYEWGNRWWNYDLPMGWEAYTKKSLEDVCAFQWYSANRAIQEYFNKMKKQYCLVRYEDIVKSLESRINEMGRIIDFIATRHDVIKQLRLDRLPVIQATEAPEHFRWRIRKDMLMPLLEYTRISEMCSRLGYGRDAMREWL